MTLLQSLHAYAARHPAESAPNACLAFLDAVAYPFDRFTHVGHFTGSAWLVSADGLRVLLTHHRKLNRWLQLGGHADGDSDLAAVALREAYEESGLPSLRGEDVIFDLDCHEIPARGEEAAHWHYDVRYVVHATGPETFAISDESNALAWMPIGQLAADDDTDESLRRMAKKWLLRIAQS